jgi:hypothetical protein
MHVVLVHTSITMIQERSAAPARYHTQVINYVVVTECLSRKRHLHIDHGVLLGCRGAQGLGVHHIIRVILGKSDSL